MGGGEAGLGGRTAINNINENIAESQPILRYMKK